MTVNVPSIDEVRHWIAQWREWLSVRTDALLSLDERARDIGSDGDRGDVAAAFVVHKAISSRIVDVESAAARGDREGAAQRAAAPLTDELGGAVAASPDEAATLLDAIVGRVTKRLDAIEQTATAEIRAAHAVQVELDAADRLSTTLGMHANRLASIRTQLASRRDLAALAAEAAAVRAELETASRRRTELLTAIEHAPERLAGLAADEAGVRELAVRCREKIKQAPPLAVPNVGAIRLEHDRAALEAMPWSPARAIVEPLLQRIDRLQAALAEARRRFQAPLDERDELRGLLQAFRDKAGASGMAETVEVDGAYREAQSVLWNAPCDLDAGRRLTREFVALVNSAVGAGSGTGAGTTGKGQAS